MNEVFAMIDCDLPHSKKIQRACAGNHGLAKLLYIQGILFSKQKLTDGEVTRSSLPAAAVGIEFDVNLLVKALVDNDLWEVTQDGWRIPLKKWKEWNDTKEEVESKRRKDRKRKAKPKDSERNPRGTTPDSAHQSTEYRGQSTENTNTTPTLTPPTPSEPNDAQPLAGARSSEPASPSSDGASRESSGNEVAVTGDASDAPPAKHQRAAPVIDWAKFEELERAWNELPEGLTARVTPGGSDSRRELWKLAHGPKKRALLDALSDVPQLMAAIRASPCLDRRRDPSATWFEFSWLFEKHTQSKQWKAVRILDGIYKREPFNAREQRQELLKSHAGESYDHNEPNTGVDFKWGSRGA